MSYTFVGASSGTTSLTPPATQIGDLVLVFSFRDGSTTLPGAPVNMTASVTRTGTTCCARVSYAVVTDNYFNVTSVASANATTMICMVYRPDPGVTPGVGVTTSSVGTTATVSINNPFGMASDGTSWVAAFIGHRSTDTNLSLADGNGVMADRTNPVDATDEAIGMDTDGPVASFAFNSGNVGGTASGWVSLTLELTGAAHDDPGFGGAGRGTQVGSGDLVVNCPAVVDAGDLLLAAAGLASTTDFSPTAPSGWTTFGAGNSGSTTGRFWHRTADGSEDGSTVTFANASSGDKVGLIARYANVGSIHAQSSITADATETYECSITTTVETRVVLMMWIDGTSGVTEAGSRFVGTGGITYRGKTYLTGDMVVIGDGVLAAGTHTVGFTADGTGNDARDAVLLAVALEPAGGGSAYDIVADAGAMDMTGTAATMKRGQIIGAGAGSMDMTGTDADLTIGRVILGGAGVMTMTGQPATPLAARMVDVEAGTMDMAGQPATLVVGKVVAALAGSMTMTGDDPNLIAARKTVAAAGSMAMAGQDASLNNGKRLAASAGAMAMTGTDATFTRAHQLDAASGSMDMIGTDAGLRNTRSIDADPGSMAMTGTAAALIRGGKTTAEAGAMTITGQAAGIIFERSITAEVGAYAMAGTDADFILPKKVEAEAGSMAMAGTDATLRRGGTIEAEAGAMAMSGGAAGLMRALHVVASAGSMDMTGVNASLSHGLRLVAEDASYAMTGQDATLFKSLALVAEAGSYAITGTSAGIARTRFVTAESGAMEMTGQDAAIFGFVPPTSERIATVEQQTRVVVVEYQSRSVSPEAEIRLVLVPPGEARGVSVEAETRAVTVPQETREV
jgi:hypothetical protein